MPEIIHSTQHFLRRLYSHLQSLAYLPNMPMPFGNFHVQPQSLQMSMPSLQHQQMDGAKLEAAKLQAVKEGGSKQFFRKKLYRERSEKLNQIKEQKLAKLEAHFRQKRHQMRMDCEKRWNLANARVKNIQRKLGINNEALKSELNEVRKQLKKKTDKLAKTEENMKMEQQKGLALKNEMQKMESEMKGRLKRSHEQQQKLYEELMATRRQLAKANGETQAMEKEYESAKNESSKWIAIHAVCREMLAKREAELAAHNLMEAVDGDKNEEIPQRDKLPTASTSSPVNVHRDAGTNIRGQSSSSSSSLIGQVELDGGGGGARNEEIGHSEKLVSATSKSSIANVHRETNNTLNGIKREPEEGEEEEEVGMVGMVIYDWKVGKREKGDAANNWPHLAIDEEEDNNSKRGPPKMQSLVQIKKEEPAEETVENVVLVKAWTDQEKGRPTKMLLRERKRKPNYADNRARAAKRGKQ